MRPEMASMGVQASSCAFCSCDQLSASLCVLLLLLLLLVLVVMACSATAAGLSSMDRLHSHTSTTPPWVVMTVMAAVVACV